MVRAEQDERKAFVVAQQHIIGWPIAFDELRLQQQRLCLAAGGDNLHRPGRGDHPLQPLGQAADLGIVGNPVFQRQRLADIQNIAARIQHAVNPGPLGQGADNAANNLRAAL